MLNLVEFKMIINGVHHIPLVSRYNMKLRIKSEIANRFIVPDELYQLSYSNLGSVKTRCRVD